MFELLIPLFLLFLSAYAIRKRCNVYSLMVDGVQDGFRVLLTVAPSLIILLASVKMLRASGFFDVMSTALSPIFTKIGISPELLPLMLIRPVSGSAALAVAAELMKTHGADSSIGRTAAIMLGSTETTFYTISVYFGAAKVRCPRYAAAAAVCSDLVGFACAIFFEKLFFEGI